MDMMVDVLEDLVRAGHGGDRTCSYARPVEFIW